MFNAGHISCRSTYDARTGEYTLFVDEVMNVDLYMEFPTLEDAQAFVSQYPKSLKLYASVLYKMNNEKVGMVRFAANFRANKTTGDVNETSVKRTAKFLELFGDKIDETAPNFNYIRNKVTVEQLKAFIAAKK